MASAAAHTPIDEKTYQRRIRAWTMYDWANSAFATTILAAVLPAYYSGVAGATLPSEAIATAYWSVGLSLSLFLIAILAPILGTVSDVMRGKKPFLTIFAGIGIVATGLLVFAGTGDWLLASLLFVLGRIGFTGANVFYDALLPHVAKSEDEDSVSTRGYAMGYLGGGLLLAINVIMIKMIPDSLFEYAGIRLSFLSVAIWWAVFSIPLLRQVPEPPAATARLEKGETVIGVSFQRIWATLKDISHYRELFKYLVAFLIYNDAIGTIIGVAVIYGAELGFGTTELLLALLLVQFVGIPFSLIFGRLPNKNTPRRPFYLAFIVFNLVALPVVGIIAAKALPRDITGAAPDSFDTMTVEDANYYGEGVYKVGDPKLTTSEGWEMRVVSGKDLAGKNTLSFLTGTPDDVMYAASDALDARFTVAVNGDDVTITHSTGPDHGIWAVEIDGQPLMETVEEDGQDVEQPVTIDAYSETVRYGKETTIAIPEAGHYTLSLVNTDQTNPDSTGNVMALAQIEVMPPVRENSLPFILVALLVVEALGLAFAYLFARLFTRLAETLNTKRSIILSLVIYSVIAIWGFFIDSTVEFWFLAWMVAIVQGGSQALSRSLFASMSPAAKSGEFFGFYGIMEKFSAILGPLIFAFAATTFDSSRPAILSLIAFFIIGGYLLTRVNVDEGRRIAHEEDAALLGVA